MEGAGTHDDIDDMVRVIGLKASMRFPGISTARGNLCFVYLTAEAATAHDEGLVVYIPIIWCWSNNPKVHENCPLCAYEEIVRPSLTFQGVLAVTDFDNIIHFGSWPRNWQGYSFVSNSPLETLRHLDVHEQGRIERLSTI